MPKPKLRSCVPETEESCSYTPRHPWAQLMSIEWSLHAGLFSRVLGFFCFCFFKHLASHSILTIIYKVDLYPQVSKVWHRVVM